MARSTENSKRRPSSKAVRTLSIKQACQSRWKIRAGPILALRVVMLSPRAWAPRTESFSENRPSDWIRESSWPLASNSSRRPRRSRTCCLTLPSNHSLSTMSRYVREPLVCVRTNKSALLCHYHGPRLGTIAIAVFSYLQIFRATRILRWPVSPCLESISCGHLASPTVEDECYLLALASRPPPQLETPALYVYNTYRVTP